VRHNLLNCPRRTRREIQVDIMDIRGTIGRASAVSSRQGNSNPKCAKKDKNPITHQLRKWRKKKKRKVE
jgi:hypothetical protein